MTGAESTSLSRVMATWRWEYSSPIRCQVSPPGLFSPVLKRKVILIWPDWVSMPPKICELVSIMSPVRRSPLTSSSSPLSRGAGASGSGPSALQATSGLAGSSAPLSGSGSSEQVISIAAAFCRFGSSD